MNNIDSRGLKRGRCDCGKCEQFEWTPTNVGSFCTYCGCVPVKHVKLEDGQKSGLENSSGNLRRNDELLNSRSGPSTINTPSEKPNCEKYDSASESILKIGSKKENAFQMNIAIKKNCTLKFGKKTCKRSMKENETPLESLIPTTLPHNLDKLIKAGVQLDDKQKLSIIREVCRNMIKEGKDKIHLITSVNIILCDKFPFLKGPSGMEYVSTLGKIKSCLKNLKRNPVKKDSSTVLHMALCSEMEKEISSVRAKPPNIAKLKELMDKTRFQRQKEVNEVSASTFLTTYPALKLTDLLIWEFSKIVEVPVAVLRANWMDAIPKILISMNETVNADANINEMCVNILLKLPKIFIGTSLKVEKDVLLTIYPTGIILSSIVPALSEPPRLIGLSNNTYNNASLICYADGVCAFSATAFDAVLLLIALYWVLNISLPTSSRLQFSFISMAVLRKAGVKKGLMDVLKMPTFTKILTTVGLSD